MALPKLTDEQRKEALAKAAEARKARAELKAALKRGETDLPRSYIYATRATQADTFGQFARRTKHESGWRYFEIDASHSPNVTAPEALMAMLEEITAQAG